MEKNEQVNSENRNTTVTLYISAVGAALIATFFDFVRNLQSSAVTKTAVAIKEHLQLTGTTSSASIAAIIIFGIIGAILVCAYRPKETKESFLLGLSVLVVAGLGVPPITPKPEQTKVSGIGELIPHPGIFLMSTAYAQEPRAPREERRIWIFVDGPGQRQIPEVRAMVYSGTDGRLLVNSVVYTKFYLTVPTGTHQVEIYRDGYRSVSFKISPTRENSAYRVPMVEVGFFSAANFLGPESVSIAEDTTLTESLANSVNQCQRGSREAAAKSATEAGVKRDKLDRETRRLLCL